MRTAASFSACGRYRYRLERIWDDARPPMAFVMLNPSTADATHDDPTIRRCLAFARRENAGGLLVGNLFAWRSTDPKAMKAAPDPVGDLNTSNLLQMGREAGGRVVAAWGAHGAYKGQAAKVLALLRGACIAVFHFGLTKDGHPKHPLYLPKDAPLALLGGKDV